MSYTFIYRSDNTFDAYVSQQGKPPALYSLSMASTPTVDADASAIGGYSLNMYQAGTAAKRWVIWPGRLNFPTGDFSFGCRVLMHTAVGSVGICGLSHPNLSFYGIAFIYDTNASKGFGITYYDDYGAVVGTNWVGSQPTMDTWYDLMVTWKHSERKIAAYLNQTAFVNETDITSYGSWEAIVESKATRDSNKMGKLVAGLSPSTSYINGAHYLNEIWLANSVLSPATLGLGTARSAFLTATAFDGSVNTGAGAANIRSGQSETINGTVTNGTLLGSVLQNGS